MNRVTTVVEGNNADLMVAVAQIYIRPDDTVMDVTYGKGAFWRKYRHPGPFIAHDLELDGVDFTQLPEANAAVSVTVADPPHIAPGGRTTSTIPGFNRAYGLVDAPRTPAGILELYKAGMKEWARVTRPGGIVAIKCCNGVTSGRRRWMHHQIAAAGCELGLDLWDEFILVRKTSGPQPPHARQRHADNRHSYLLVFRTPTRRTTGNQQKEKPAMMIATCQHPALPLCGGQHPGGACPTCQDWPGSPDYMQTFGPWLHTDKLPSSERVTAVADCYRYWGVYPDAHQCAGCGVLVLGEPALEES